MSLQPEPTSVVEKLLRQGLEKDKKQEVVIDRIDDYKAALDRIFDTPDGRYVMKYLLRYMGIFEDGPLNPAQLLEDKGKRGVYLRMIRPYLSLDVRRKLENQPDAKIPTEPRTKETRRAHRKNIRG